MSIVPPPPPKWLFEKKDYWKRYASGEKLIPTYDPVKLRLPKSEVVTPQVRHQDALSIKYGWMLFVPVIAAFIYVFYEIIKSFI